jgi:Ca2+-binding RTX toxin-like protein
VVLTYSFLSTVPDGATLQDANGFAPMTDTQQQGVRQALAAWAAVANITFQEVSADGNIQLGSNNQGNTSSGYAYLPDGNDPVTLYTNNLDSYNFSFADGDYGISVLIHEIGHTLGLKHPGNYDSGGASIKGPFLPSATDTLDYSQMSYNVGAGYALNHNYGITAMLYDIQAIQYLYGANMSYHTGADTYSFAKDAALQCIWDAGGTDTFDFSACRDATVINLNAGSFSSTAPGYNNISIAYNVSIERAIAGSGGSTTYGNAAGNVILGGAGNDVIYQGAGSDQISGGGGSDTVVFTKAVSAYDLGGSVAQLTVSGDGVDTLSNIARLQFSDTVIQLSNYSALLAGTSANDTLQAGAGSLLVTAGAGIDTLLVGGSRGAYQLSASGSTVTLSGASGSDLLLGVERLQFADGALALDTAGSAGQLYRLYGAMFNRTPDAEGFGFWLDARDQGVGMVSIADSFVTSTEFANIYGANASDQTFLTALYSNVLHRAPDAEGYSWWLNALHDGATRASVLVGFSDSVENVALMSQIMPVGVAYTQWTG